MISSLYILGTFAEYPFFRLVKIYAYPTKNRVSLYLNIRRRRWVLKDENYYVSRNWKLVAQGSRMTQEFAPFLKELY